ncbi:MAG: RNase adapter RapZ [Actinomycetota bacterium]
MAGAEKRTKKTKKPKQPQLPAAPGFTIITGLSGAGRSEASRCLEDLGYFVVDNLPPALISKMAELAQRPGGPSRIAFVVDARGGKFFLELAEALEALKEQGVPYRILFLEASEEQLVNRYEATRRKHPLASGDRMVEGIRKERPMMEPLREVADFIVDTTDLTPHELRDRVRETFAEAPPEESLQVNLVSFGFKYGAPRDADLVFDVRFLPNPHWVDTLRPLPGTDERVRGYVKGQKGYREFMRRFRSLLEFVLPGYVSEGKHYLTIAIGCTGGRHRSVVVSEELATFFRGRYLPVSIEHRDLDKGGN